MKKQQKTPPPRGRDRTRIQGNELPRDASLSFEADEVLAGRFRVLRPIAEGAMGAVWEAYDLELREVVAVKTILPGIAQHADTLARFKREIRLARKVTHENVSRIFDVFRHEHPPRRPVTFLTMELLRGETLASRLRRVERMSIVEALPLVRQMADGLDAAHRAGVVHRDFKTSNVMLVESKEGTRAVVTDFGIACQASGDDTLTSPGGEGILGTPAYMAPEQIHQSKVTALADVYALGVVLFEMVTGVRPFGNDLASTLVKRVMEPAPSPRRHVPDLDPRWEAVILRCLERDPAARYPSAGEVYRALAAEPALAIVSEPSPTRAPTRRSVAVIGFKNLARRTDAEWLSTALAEMLSTELGAGGELRIIPGENVARMKMDLAIQDAESFAAETLGRIRAHMGADLVLLGSYLALGESGGGQLRIDARIQDTGTGATLASVAQNGAEASLFDLVARVGQEVRERLGLSELSVTQVRRVKSSLPASPEAAKLYAEGLGKLRQGEALAARTLLEQAIAADASHPMPHWALSEALSVLGDDARARRHARSAYDLSADLPREDRLIVEAWFHQTMFEWDKAIEIYRSLWAFFPDNAEHGLSLVVAELNAGRPRDAKATIERLRAMPAPASTDPRVDIHESDVCRALSDATAAKAAAERAHGKACVAGARFLEAEALLLKGQAQWDLGNADDALASYKAARERYSESGSRYGVARVLTAIGWALASKGDKVQSRRIYEKLLDVYREIGDLHGVASCLSALASLQTEQDPVAARRLTAEALEIYRGAGDRPDVARLLGNIATISEREGDLAGAAVSFEEALRIARDVGDKGLSSWCLARLASLSLKASDVVTARRRADEAVDLARQGTQRQFTAFALRTRGEVLLAGQDLVPAHAVLLEAFDFYRDTGLPAGQATTLLILARVHHRRGKIDEARAAVTEAMGLAQSIGDNRIIADCEEALAAIAPAPGA